MGQLFSALTTVLLGLGGFVGGLLVLYAATNIIIPKSRREGSQIIVFLGPALVLIVIGLVIPAIRTIYLSLLSDAKGQPFGGLTNYKFIFTDSDSRDVLINSAMWVFLGGTVSTALALFIARFADKQKGESIAKALIFIPSAMSLVGAGIIWKFVYDGPPFGNGLLNAITKAIPGLPDRMGGDGQRIWLLEPVGSLHMNTLLLIVILIWLQTGFATVVLSAAIKGVPESLEEAATVDGASSRQEFFKVTLPYIRPALLTVMTTGTGVPLSRVGL